MTSKSSIVAAFAAFALLSTTADIASAGGKGGGGVKAAPHMSFHPMARPMMQVRPVFHPAPHLIMRPTAHYQQRTPYVKMRSAEVHHKIVQAGGHVKPAGNGKAMGKDGGPRHEYAHVGHGKVVDPVKGGGSYGHFSKPGDKPDAGKTGGWNVVQKDNGKPAEGPGKSYGPGPNAGDKDHSGDMPKPPKGGGGQVADHKNDGPKPPKGGQGQHDGEQGGDKPGPKGPGDNVVHNPRGEHEAPKGDGGPKHGGGEKGDKGQHPHKGGWDHVAHHEEGPTKPRPQDGWTWKPHHDDHKPDTKPAPVVSPTVVTAKGGTAYGGNATATAHGGAGGNVNFTANLTTDSGSSSSSRISVSDILSAFQGFAQFTASNNYSATDVPADSTGPERVRVVNRTIVERAPTCISKQDMLREGCARADARYDETNHRCRKADGSIVGPQAREDVGCIEVTAADVREMNCKAQGLQFDRQTQSCEKAEFK